MFQVNKRQTPNEADVKIIETALQKSTERPTVVEEDIDLCILLIRFIIIPIFLTQEKEMRARRSTIPGKSRRMQIVENKPFLHLHADSD